MSEWIDISVPLRNGMVCWPGDQGFRIQRDRAISLGDNANLSSFSTTAHIGTHMDAPLHFIDGAPGIDQTPPDTLIGPARVVEIRDEKSIRAAELERLDIKDGERILFRTRNSSWDWASQEFNADFVSISPDGARLLAARRVSFIGVDYLSVGSYGGSEGHEVHRILLGARIAIVEGLDLRNVEAGDYDLICLPMKLAGADGAPARAVVRKR
jgi:arylformamidase